MARFSFATSRYIATHDVRIDMTPLVGVLLVLVMVFMVAFPATLAIPLDVPGCFLGYRGTNPPPLFVSIMGPNEVYIGGHKTSTATFAADIKAESTGAVEPSFLVRADKDATYQDYITVLGRLKALGYTRIGMVNEDME